MTKVYELLDSPAKWCKGDFGKRADGVGVLSTDPEACQWCLLGALNVCYKEEKAYSDARDRLASAIASRGLPRHITRGLPRHITRFNDDSATTYDDVIALCKEAGV